MLQASIFWISTLTIWRRHSLSHLSLSSEAGGWIKFVSFTFFFTPSALRILIFSKNIRALFDQKTFHSSNQGMFPMVFRETPADDPPLRNRTLPLIQRMFHFDTLGGNKI